MAATRYSWNWWVNACRRSVYSTLLLLTVEGQCVQPCCYSLWKVSVFNPVATPCGRSVYSTLLLLPVEGQCIQPCCYSLWKVSVFNPVATHCGRSVYSTLLLLKKLTKKTSWGQLTESICSLCFLSKNKSKRDKNDIQHNYDTSFWPWHLRSSLEEICVCPHLQSGCVS